MPPVAGFKRVACGPSPEIPPDAQPSQGIQEVPLPDFAREARHYAFTVTIRVLAPRAAARDSMAFRCTTMASFAWRIASPSVRPWA